MKKLLSTILLLTVSLLVWSNTSDNLIKEGEKFEESNNLIYALASYYDAYGEAASDSEEAQAKVKIDELTQLIESGNPSKKTLNAFDLHDTWISVIQEYEKYFSQNCPIIIKNESLKQSGLDYKNRKVFINFKYDWVYSKKFHFISDTIRKGLRSGASELNYDLRPEFASSQKRISSQKTILITGKESENINIPAIAKEKGIYLGKDEESSYGDLIPAFRTMKHRSQNVNFVWYTTNYSTVFLLTDSNGNVLGKSERMYITDEPYEPQNNQFVSISPDAAEKINELKLTPSDVELTYNAGKSHAKVNFDIKSMKLERKLEAYEKKIALEKQQAEEARKAEEARLEAELAAEQARIKYQQEAERARLERERLQRLQIQLENYGITLEPYTENVELYVGDKSTVTLGNKEYKFFKVTVSKKSNAAKDGFKNGDLLCIAIIEIPQSIKERAKYFNISIPEAVKKFHAETHVGSYASKVSSFKSGLHDYAYSEDTIYEAMENQKPVKKIKILRSFLRIYDVKEIPFNF